MLEDMLQYNKQFVKSKVYEKYTASKYPNKKLAILSCMDTRLTELLPAALGLRNGDAKLIKNAGGTISDPFGSAMRSLLIAVHTLGVEHILVIGHSGCGVEGMDSHTILQQMRDHGISEESIDMMRYCRSDFDEWLCGFHKVETSVENSVNLIRRHPLMPQNVAVSGFVIDSETGELTPVKATESD